MRRLLDSYLDAYRDLPRDIWALSAIMLVNRAGTMVLVFLALYLTRELGHPPTFAGRVLAVYGVGHLAGAWLGGWLSDRVGSLRVQSGSLVLSGVFFLVLGQVESPRAIMAVVFLVAVAAEALRPANGAALAALAPARLRARAWALQRIALNLGFSIGPALGGWLASIDYGLLFVADGVTCIGAGLLVLVLFRGRLDAVEAVADEPATDEAPPRDISPWRDGPFLAVLGATILMALCFLQAWSTLPLDLAARFDFDEERFGLLLVVNALLILALEMPLTRATEQMPPMRVVAVGSLLVGGGYSLLVVGLRVDAPTLAAVATMVVFTFGEMVAIPASGGWVSNRAAAGRRGAYMGLFVMAWGVAWIVAPAAGTWIYERFGGDVLWLATFGCGAAGAAICLAVDRRLGSRA
ncbi:MAG: MFS transporter [Acidobacteriota bacterium]